MNYKDYYTTLGVTKSADEKDIKRAYRKLARQYHPDHNPGNQASEDKFKDINEAYEVLGNTENRQKYDQLGANYHRYQQMGGAPSGFDYSDWMSSPGMHQSGNMGGFSDFFSAIFGAQQQGMGSRPPRNRNTEHEITITLEEAYHGAQRTLQAGQDRFTAKIPQGAKTGTKIRLRGKGNAGGNLILLITVAPHPIYERKENDLTAPLNVPVLTAILGGKVTVPTLTGDVTLSIPAGTQNNRHIRLRGKGMPHIKNNDHYGDLIAQINIQVPQQLTDEEHTLYQQLAQLQT